VQNIKTLCAKYIYLKISEFRDDKQTSLCVESLTEIIPNVSKISLPILPAEKIRESTNFIYHELQEDHITILMKRLVYTDLRHALSVHTQNFIQFYCIQFS